MNGAATWPQLIFIGSIIVSSVCVGCGALLWLWNKLNTMSREISSEFKETRHTLHGKIEQVKALVDDDIDEIHQKIRDIELYNRDNFVRNDHFAQIVGAMGRQHDVLVLKIDRLYDKMEELRAAGS